MMTSYCYPVCSDTKSLPVCVSGVGVRELDGIVRRETGYAYHQLYICSEGSGKISAANKRCNVLPGDFVYIPAGTAHEFIPTDTRWQLIGVDLDGSSIETLLESIKLTKLRCEKLSDHETPARKMLAIMNTVREGGNAVVSDCSALAYDLLMQLHKQINIESETSDGQKFAQLAPVIDFVEGNYQSDLSLDKLSAIIDVSPQYLCRLFKDCYAMRPFEYLAKRRIQKAKLMLVQDKYTVNEIAQIVGYNDCSYFCSVFKKHEGISPAEFRAVNCTCDK